VAPLFVKFIFKFLYFEQKLNSIHPLLRKSDNGNIWGYGIREVPSNIDFRNYLKSNFDKIINQPSASLPSVDIF
jgi:hypothetical protein